MKVYNSNMLLKLICILLLLFFLIMAIFFIVEDPANVGGSTIIVICVLVYVSIVVRDLFCPFTIDKRGITNKLLVWNISMMWNEIGYIYIGERHYLGNYSFLVCFSKRPLEDIYFYGGKLNVQTKNHFYIIYRKGMLEEILKYVDESKIQNIERIRQFSEPWEDQSYETSMLKQMRSRHRK